MLLLLQLVTAWQPRDFHINSATLKVNESKNRDAKLLPGKFNSFLAVPEVTLDSHSSSSLTIPRIKGVKLGPGPGLRIQS